MSVELKVTTGTSLATHRRPIYKYSCRRPIYIQGFLCHLTRRYGVPANKNTMLWIV